VAARLTLDDLARLPAPGMDAPAKLSFAPDGGSALFLAPADESNRLSLWRWELSSGRRTELLAPIAAADEASLRAEDVLRRERTRERALGVTDYHVAERADRLTVVAPLDGRAHVSIDGTSATVVEGLSELQDVRLAPDGRQLAWIRDGDLYAAPLGATGTLGEVLRLSADAEDAVTNGLAEYQAAEELGRDRGFWWSRDGSAIAYAHVDERGVPPFVIQHLATDPPRVERHRYPFAGGPNPAVSLRIARLGDGAPSSRAVALPMDPGDYLARVLALPGDGWLVAVLPRVQRSLRWLRVGTDASCTELWVESASPWLNLDDHTRALADGRFLRSTEATGYRHLELRHADGGLERSLTAGPWVVTGVVAVVEARNEVLFTATRDGVLERHLYRVPLDAPRPVTDPERLTVEPGWHEVVATHDGASWIDRQSSLVSPPRVILVRREGGQHVLHEPSVALGDLGLRAPEMTTVTAADEVTELRAALYLPDHPGAAPPPAVLWVYGGPHSQKVADSWELSITLWRQFVAQLGCAVVVVDNRGTFNRGIVFEAALDHALGSVELDDQLAALDQLAGRGVLDPSRVAITGGSYGGFMTIRALLTHPDRFRGGVAWAPVVAWDGYDAAYTERYLGSPAEAAPAYRAAGLLEAAHRLERPLLIQHGMVDENVHLRHTIRFLNALNAAGLACELQLFPGSRHAARGAATLTSRDRRSIEFLARVLDMPLPEGWARAAAAPPDGETAATLPPNEVAGQAAS
jgi:dipeptidyl-peptidase-4